MRMKIETMVVVGFLGLPKVWGKGPCCGEPRYYSVDRDHAPELECRSILGL